MRKSVTLETMLVPLAVLLLAASAAAMVAFGVQPVWAEFHHGLGLIVWSRRLEWPLVALALILCLAMFAMVISGKRRAWWLIGLAPVLALLAHRFALDPQSDFFVNDQPVFISADQASFIADEDWVVGIVDGDQATAYPFAALYGAPLVLQTQQESPLLVMWSPFANRALAIHVDRSIKGRDLEIVSMPANSLLVYNSRLGEFICGITGQTLKGQTPSGFGQPIPTMKTTWKRWVALHPQTQVLLPPIAGKDAPTTPILPAYPLPSLQDDPNHGAMVALLATTRPVAVLQGDLARGPANYTDPSLVAVTDPATGITRAFIRQLDTDLFPRFTTDRHRKHAPAIMTDDASGSFWTADGIALFGPLKGKKLQPVPVDDNLNYDILRVWYPDLAVLQALR
jgi:hypothetical protein